MCTYSVWVKLNISLLSSRKTFVVIFIWIMLITNLWKWKSLSHVLLFMTPWTIQDFSRPEYWNGLPCPPLGDLPNPGSKPGLPQCRRILYHLRHQGNLRILEWVAYPFSRGSSQPRNWTGVPALQADSLPAELQGKPKNTGVSSLSLLQGIFPT